MVTMICMRKMEVPDIREEIVQEESDDNKGC